MRRSLCAKALATQRSCSQRGLAFWLQDCLERTVLSEHRGSEAWGSEAISITAAWPALQTWLPCGRSNGRSPGNGCLRVLGREKPLGLACVHLSTQGDLPRQDGGRGGLCQKGPFLWNQHIM